MKPLERVAILLLAVALAVGLIAVLSGYFAGHDQPSVTTQRAPAGAP